jgi:hypothetical protein
MKHSVWCRAAEIENWYGQDLDTAVDALRDEHEAVVESIREARLAPVIRARALNAADPLERWAAALSR